MEWKKIINIECMMPFDRPFLAIWEYKIVLAEWEESTGRFFIIRSPADERTPYEVQPINEDRFTHWMDLPKEPRHLQEY
jgi:hypothetical protein